MTSAVRLRLNYRVRAEIEHESKTKQRAIEATVELRRAQLQRVPQCGRRPSRSDLLTPSPTFVRSKLSVLVPGGGQHYGGDCQDAHQ